MKVFPSLFLVFVSIALQAQTKFETVVSHLDKYIDDVVVLSSGASKIAVSPSYQARVFTSSLNGDEGNSLGWINWESIDAGNSHQKMAYLGGESRLWFAPEFGPYSLFHEPKDTLSIATMRAPKDLDTKKFDLVKLDSVSVLAKGTMSLQNHTGTSFDISIRRKIRLLNKRQVENSLNTKLPSNVQFVGFKVATLVKNRGTAWQKKTGLLGIWELGCNLTSPDTKVIIPLEKPLETVTEYFGDLTSDRLKLQKKAVFFKTDAAHVSKIGILPKHAKNMMGSYSKSKGLLSIVRFNLEKGNSYMSSVPGAKKPYKGDVINIFNGEVDSATNKNWPFYEFESSSLAKTLKTNDKIAHSQTTYHFKGNFISLNAIAKRVLGVGLSEVNFD